MRPRPVIIVIMVCVFFSFYSCTEEVEPLGYSYPIDLTVSASLGNVSLQWTDVNVTSFERYLLVRSTDSIPDVRAFQTTIEQNTLTQIEHHQDNSFSDTTLLLETIVYYKVFAHLGDRLLQSPTIKVIRPVYTLDHFPAQISFDPQKNEVIGYEEERYRLFTFDLDERKTTHFGQFFSGDVILSTGDYEGIPEAYLANKTNRRLYVFERPQFVFDKWIQIPLGVADFKYHKGRFIIATMSGSVQVIDRGTADILDSQTTPSGGNKIQLLDSGADYLDFMVISPGEITSFRLQDDQLEPRGSITKENTGQFSAAHTGINLVVIGSSGHVLDGELKTVGYLPDEEISHRAFTFSPNGEYIVSIGSRSGRGVLSLYDTNGDLDVKQVDHIGLLPHFLWSDSANIYSLRRLSVSGQIKAVINMYDLIE